MADHFEEVIGLRVSALEARVAAEAESVKEHFAELQLFITFSLARQRAELRTEFAGDFRRIDQRLDGVEQRLGTVEQRLGTVEQRLGHLEDFNRRVEAHHEATRLILSDILDRLPARRG